ncbi:hypothetical protein BG36_16495 [Aquamicrobium defluvii]|uniref:Uncharacterized protein n=1 Tax=Aquamicrobium defluvii TaxID=69279 RepID=A0A011U798_9HYPH|nr:hypothetical protein BG36_16495 [Aquamicrobium defluvii]
MKVQTPPKRRTKVSSILDNPFGNLRNVNDLENISSPARLHVGCAMGGGLRHAATDAHILLKHMHLRCRHLPALVNEF